MKFSVALPMLPPDHFLPLARAAEAAGYEGVAVPESVFFPENVSADYPYSADGGRYWDATTPFLDPFVAIPAMAAVTERRCWDCHSGVHGRVISLSGTPNAHRPPIPAAG